MKLPWIKVYIEIIDDPKLSQLSEAHKWRYVQMLLLAGECDAEGYLISSGVPLQVEEMGWRLRLNAKTLQADLEALSKRSLLVFDEQTAAWLIPSFAQRQSRPDDAQRAYWREKKRKQRRRNSQPTLPDLD